MKLRQYQVDAFAAELFAGNPAAVVPLDEWLSDETMQAIAMENNLSETAFFVPTGSAFGLRWFTPEAEVDLCGHATLASAYVLFERLGYSEAEIRFETRSGPLIVRRREDGLEMDFPASRPRRCEPPENLVNGLRREPTEVLAAADYLAVFGSEREVLELEPDFALLGRLGLRGVCVTAPGDEVDFVSRFFAPHFGIPEDPVTGSAHCQLTPYWATRLGKNRLQARQVSRRGGEVLCELRGDRVLLVGRAVLFLEGTIETGE